jgi:5-methyltetrahydropteroyltriglutamate--homocysteine methyltransferase
MSIPSEPIGSIPRSATLQQALADYAVGKVDSTELQRLYNEAVKDTVDELHKTGSTVITDGEQTKPSFATYPLAGLTNLAPDGVEIHFEDGHKRQLPRLTEGPFQYGEFAGSYLPRLKKFTDKPIKQSVISASAISLLYPGDGIEGYSQDQFISDLVENAVEDIRSCFRNGAETVQIDFTEGRLAVKLDPSKGLLKSFVDLNNQVLSHFTPEERQRIGVHVCPGGDHDSTHSADVPYEELIPDLFNLDVGSFYVQMASEDNPDHALAEIAKHIKTHQRVFVGVTDVLNPDVESPEEVRDRVLAAAKHIPLNQLGTTDDCGFSPFADDAGTSREIAFAKIQARLEGTRLAEEALGL